MNKKFKSENIFTNLLDKCRISYYNYDTEKLNTTNKFV